MIPWNNVKWAKANVKLGLKRDEICPGVTVKQHAESLAMFEMHNTPTNNKAWVLSIPILRSLNERKIMSVFVETDIVQ
jgi:hypothetical protein